MRNPKMIALDAMTTEVILRSDAEGYKYSFVYDAKRSESESLNMLSTFCDMGSRKDFLFIEREFKMG